LNHFRHALIVANPISGKKRNKRQILEYLQRRLHQQGVASEIMYTQSRGHATEIARQASVQKVDLIVALGGDGTMNEVAAGLISSDAAMAIVPLGSGNGLARSLGVPLDYRKAADLIFTGQVRSIDVGKLNGRYFVLLAGVGFDAVVGQRFEDHHSRGPLPYFYLSLQAFFQYKPEQFTLTFEDQRLQLTPFILTVANGLQYGNNAFVAPHAKLDDGLLNICILHEFKSRHVFTVLPRIFSGTVHRYPKADFFQVRELTIERRDAGLVNIDGEVVPEERIVNISILPGSLKVIAPANSPGLS